MTDFKLECRDWEVRAFLDGRRTMLRKPAWRLKVSSPPAMLVAHKHRKPTIWQSVKPGDRLWVRETWKRNPDFGPINANGFVMYRADPGHDHDGPWRPSIHMPRWASRLTLIITETKRERVQEITWQDAIAEGCDGSKTVRQFWLYGSDAEARANIIRVNAPNDYARLWQSLHTKPGTRWEDNPEVVALSVTVHQQNIDALEKAA